MSRPDELSKEPLFMDHFPRRPPVNLAFRDIRYEVLAWSKLKPQKKEILHGIHGEFRSGELTAIMGPSGAGKSTLLNILAGFTLKGIKGEVLVNGQSRRKVGYDEFKKVSCYIQQDDVVRPLLTVEEAMTLAAHLKLGCSVSREDKFNKIVELLNMLGLADHRSTLSGQLSGGQKKRLAIAFELITNPPVIFLDEPTTGLDSCSTTSCVALLKRLARQGRTIVCTLHQPSALIFEQFTQVYVLATGISVYQGSPADVPSFMANFGLICPPYHNPADFVIEVAAGDYPRDIDKLSSAAQTSGQEMCITSTEEVKEIEGGKGLELLKLKSFTSKKSNISDSDLGTVRHCLPKPASLWIQLFYLYNRNIIVLKRSVRHILLRFLAHLVIALVFGYLYQGVGNDAETLLANFIFVYGTNLFLHYTGQMTVLLSFPLEYQVLTREHFNRWYSLAPYVMALLLVEIPCQIACSLIYIAPGYYLTEQPLEWNRFGMFVLFNLAISLTAQGTGFLAGALLPVTVAVFIAPVFSVFFSVFGFTSKYSDIPIHMRPFYNVSYFRSAFQGSFTALYDNNRADLPCYEFYCHYKHPTTFLREMEMASVDHVAELSYIIGIGVFAYSLTVLSVWFKLTKR